MHARFGIEIVDGDGDVVVEDHVGRGEGGGVVRVGPQPKAACEDDGFLVGGGGGDDGGFAGFVMH